MTAKFTRMLFLVLLVLSGQSASAQTTLTQWNFNSNPPDGNTSTGTTAPSIGNGSVGLVGGVTATFSAGTSNGGSSDPATSDNSGWQTTGYAAQNTGNKTTGIEFSVSTAGYSNIIVSYDLRHSNTSSRYELLQYTADITAANPVWTDAQVFDGNAGDTWFNRSYNLSGDTALNNKPNAGFRIVAAFDPLSSGYMPSNSGSTYSGSGTWRFDMVTVQGTSVIAGDIIPPVAQLYQTRTNNISFVKFNEPLDPSTATDIANYVFSGSVSVSSAILSLSGDTVFLNHTPVVNGQPYTLTVSGVKDIAQNTMASTVFNVLFNSSLPDLVITEIIHSPNNIEMIEVYNAGSVPLNLGGLKWTDGTSGDFPAVSLAAGTTALFATSPTTASSILGVTPVYTINNGLGASNDILVIRNSLNQVIDSVDYYVGANGWPTAPTGVYAYSFELISAAVDNNTGSNWIVPVNTVTPQPSQGIIRATPGVYPPPPVTSPLGIVSFVGTIANVNETAASVSIVANLTGGGADPSSVEIELMAFGTATAGTDFILPATLQFNWPANVNNMSDTITISIVNDALPEGAEYFAVRFTNPVNVTLPPVSANNFIVYILDDDKYAPTASQQISLTHLGSFSNGASGSNSAEIVVHDPLSRKLFIANSIAGKIDIVNFSNPFSLSLIGSVDITPYGNINSVAVNNGIVAAAIEDNNPQANGKVVFFDTAGTYISQATVGAMPDMITFNHAGTKVLIANEGEPNTSYTVDPEGSVSIIDISGGVASVSASNVTTVTFTAFNSQVAALKSAGVRIFGPNATVAQDIEPEYITVSPDDATAYVTCQENNAIAVVDIATGIVTNIFPLGTKDHMLPGNTLDASDQGSVIQMANYPVKGLYMPDAIASYTVGGQTYLVTANEGDAREWNALIEAVRLGNATYLLDTAVFPDGAALKAAIGRLTVTTQSGDIDNDGDFDEIHAFGARSFSIWNASTGALVWDSGDDFEMITSQHPVFGAIFNASNANNTLKNRSDDKGPEPEGVAIGTINGNTYAFIALERIGGVMVYDITNPVSPVFVDYKNTRDLVSYGGDNGAEGIIFIAAANAPNSQPLVVVANEVSSTITIYQVNTVPLNIVFYDINAVNEGRRNRIEWGIANAQEYEIFEVERSSDGFDFRSLSVVKARSENEKYVFYDEQPVSGKNYYRLRMVNKAGELSYSKIVVAEMRADEPFALNIYPNPVKDRLTIAVAGEKAGNAIIEIADISGVLLRSVKMDRQQITIHTADLPSGMYTVKYADDNRSHVVKIGK